MKIKTLGISKKCERLRQWHKKFVFFPKQVGDEDSEYQFLCYVARKYNNLFDYYYFSRLGEYEYKDIHQYITEKLMNK